MIERFRRISAIVTMAVILALGATSSARANLQIQLSTDGTHWTEVAHDVSGGNANFSTSGGAWIDPHGTVNSGFTVSSLATDSNSPGTPQVAFLDGSTTSLTNVAGGTRTLYIKLGDTGFTSPFVPGGSLLFDSFISGTVLTSRSANAMVFKSWVDPADGQNSTVGLSTPSQSPSIVSAHTPSVYSDDKSIDILTLNTAFSMTEYFKVTLGAGGKISFNTTSSLTLMPEPSSLAVAGLGAICLVGYGFRRRKSA